jgi:hypothetical protein
MSEYRVMHVQGAYQIQEKVGRDGWQTVGEFDDIEAARKMVRDLREGTLCD